MRDIDLKRLNSFETCWPLSDSGVQRAVDNKAMEALCSSPIMDCRLASQPLKKYKQDPILPFKKRLIGTLNRMEAEGGHSSEILETIASLIEES